MSGHDSELAAALAFYRRETATANRAFFQGKIDALYSHAELNDKQRLDKLAPYFGDGSWGTEGYGSSITSPRQLLLHPGEPGYLDLGIDNDGTVPPETEQARTQYLDQLRGLLREVAGPDVPEPAEFAELITMTDAIADRDFRRSGTAGLNGTWIPLKRNDMSDRLPDQFEWYSTGWRVVAGWRCAYGSDVGATSILYAQKEDGTQDEQQLKWRVYTWDENEYEDGMWFSSIAQYLRYRCQWYQRLPAGWQDQWLGPPVDSLEWREEGEEDEEEEEEEEDDE